MFNASVTYFKIHKINFTSIFLFYDRNRVYSPYIFLLAYLFTADNFNVTDDVQDNAVMGLAYSTFQRILGNSPQVLNPIDRLYSMQNYYFRCNNRQPNELDDNDGM